MDGDKVDFVSEGNDAKKTTIDCSHVSFVFCGSFETLLQNVLKIIDGQSI